MRESYEIQVQQEDNGTFVAVVTLSRGRDTWTGKPVPLKATTWDEANKEAYAKSLTLASALRYPPPEETSHLFGGESYGSLHNAHAHQRRSCSRKPSSGLGHDHDRARRGGTQPDGGAP